MLWADVVAETVVISIVADEGSVNWVQLNRAIETFLIQLIELTDFLTGIRAGRRQAQMKGAMP